MSKPKKKEAEQKVDINDIAMAFKDVNGDICYSGPAHLVFGLRTSNKKDQRFMEVMKIRDKDKVNQDGRNESTESVSDGA